MEVRETKSLEIGEVFERDLIDADGNIVLRAGRMFTEDALAQLRLQGCFNVFYVESEDADDLLLKPYDESCLRSVHRLLANAPDKVEDCWQAVRDGEAFQRRMLESNLSSAMKIVENDAAALISGVMRVASDGSAVSLAARSVNLGTLAMVVAEFMNFSQAECYAVARAGLLHDISLDAGIPWLSKAASNSSDHDRLALDYFSHPQKSIEILRQKQSDLSELEFVLMAQVHEQCDGSGFPRRLRKHHLHPLSRLLNVVDAFLTLTDPANPKGALVPADAMAYQVYHALSGSFDLACTQALVKATAIYPIGTEVRLSDDSIGTVMRATGGDYCQPVVRRVNEPNKLLDLRQSSIRIEAPHASGKSSRLPKSKLSENLWLQSS